MNRQRIGFVTLAAVAVATGLLMTGSTSLAGSLTPPGPPAPTMKPLDQVEPRTPISSLPFTINTAGSYYLTQNLSYTGSVNGITVNAGPTTIDLNGFTLDGGLSGQYGILCDWDLQVRNGYIKNWQFGVVSSNGEQRLESVSVQSCRGGGVYLNDATIHGCTFALNNGNAAYVSGRASITDSKFVDNTVGIYVYGYDALVDGCTITGNGIGVELGARATVQHCVVNGNFGTGIKVGSNALVIENNVSGNYDDGISAGNGSGSRLESNNVQLNGGFGIVATGGSNMIVKNSARGNTSGNYYVTGGGNVVPIDTGLASTNPWVNFSF